MSSSQLDNWQRCGYSWSRQRKPQLPMVALTKVAEEVNKMDTIYDQLFKQYSEELEAIVKTMKSRRNVVNLSGFCTISSFVKKNTCPIAIIYKDSFNVTLLFIAIWCSIWLKFVTTTIYRDKSQYYFHFIALNTDKNRFIPIYRDIFR